MYEAPKVFRVKLKEGAGKECNREKEIDLAGVFSTYFMDKHLVNLWRGEFRALDGTRR